jgi:prevent-host-death family protein
MTKSKGTAKSTSGPRANGPRWPLAVAKSRLSEIIRLAREEGPQIITSHGQDVVRITPTSPKNRHYQQTGTGMDFVLASIPYRELEDDEVEFDTSFHATSRPIDLP